MSIASCRDDAMRSRLAGLTERERSVLMLVAMRRVTVGELATVLGLSRAAARNAVATVRRKLAVPRYQDLPSFVAGQPVLAEAVVVSDALIQDGRSLQPA